jgi:hypothetical protein
MTLRAIEATVQHYSTNINVVLERRVTTLLNAIYCEEDIYMHPYRVALSLKEWKITYLKSKVDFSTGVRINKSQFETLNEYSKRVNLCEFFNKIGFEPSNTELGYYKIKFSGQIECLLEFLNRVHTAAGSEVRQSELK